MKALRIIAILLVGLFVAYVLSIGPATRWVWSGPSQGEREMRGRAVTQAYAPVVLLMKFRPIKDAVHWYNELWKPEPEKAGRPKNPN